MISMFSSKILQGLLSLAILIALLLYLIFGTPILIGTPSSPQNKTADTYLQQGKSWQYNQQGELSHLLKSSSLYHFKTGSMSTLENPQLFVYSDGDLTWTARALRGNIAHDSQTIVLQSSVVLKNSKRNIHLTTSAMTVLPGEKLARSDTRTVIVDSESQLEAQSMSADLSSNKVTLESQVKGYYAHP